jgi:hypothetical protein
VNWRLQLTSTPRTRFTDLAVDAMTDPTYSPQIIAVTEVGAHLQITGMPSQAPAPTVDQRIEGYTESISDSMWAMALNTSNYSDRLVLVLDDPVLGKLDAANRLAY